MSDRQRRGRSTRRVALSVALLTTAAAAAVGWVGTASGAAIRTAAVPPAASVVGDVYLSPTGNDANPGTAAAPVRTVQKAQSLVRALNQNMTRDVTVVLEDGFYRMSSPLTLTAADSGTNGHDVVWTADTGARPVLAGSAQITGWARMSSGSPIWVAQAPAGLQTRQLYVNGVRAARANGALPNALTGQDPTGYSGGGSTLASWRNPSGAKPQLEFVYRGGLGAWTEPRCPVASFSGAAVAMAQPCWTNSTARAGAFPDGRAYNLVGRSSITEQPTGVENAFQFLGAGTPGQWFLDQGDSKLYYVPRPGETMAGADVEAPVLEKLVTGGGSASAPLHGVAFDGIQFSYATWLGPQFHGQGSSDGFSEIQANYQVTGANGAAAQGLCHVPPAGLHARDLPLRGVDPDPRQRLADVRPGHPVHGRRLRAPGRRRAGARRRLPARRRPGRRGHRRLGQRDRDRERGPAHGHRRLADAGELGHRHPRVRRPGRVPGRHRDRLRLHRERHRQPQPDRPHALQRDLPGLGRLAGQGEGGAAGELLPRQRDLEQPDLRPHEPAERRRRRSTPRASPARRWPTAST